MVEDLIKEINSAGYTVEAYQFSSRWEVQLHGPKRASEITYGATFTEALTGSAEKIRGVAAEAALLD